MRWNAVEFALPYFSWSRRCNCHRKSSLLYRPHNGSMSVFVVQIEKAFDLYSLPKDDENVIETREFVQFGNEGFTKSFVSATVRDL